MCIRDRTTGTATTLSDGTPFTLKDGAWEASYGRTLTLKDDNEPPVRNIGLSDGSKHEITWGEPTLHDGKVVREGTASGEIQGQKWQATLTAERDTDHTGLTQAVAAARQAYDQGAGEYTAASLENLADAIEQADELDRTGATDEAMDAMRDRLAEAVGNLDTITWKTDGTTLSHEKGQGYDGKAPDTADAAPGDTVALASNDPTLGKLGSITIGRVQNDDPATLTDEDLGVARATGTAHYEGITPNGNRPATWSQDYSYTLGKRVEATGPDGHDIGFIAGSGYLSATVTASLDQANQPKDADVTIDGRKAQVTWSGQVHTTTTDTTTTYTRQGRVEGDVKVAGTDRTQHWIVYVSASRTEGHVAGLSLIQRKPDGTTSRHDISGFDPSRHEYAITMPADAVADQYTLGHTSAAGDKADVSEGDPVAPTLGANASRILKTTLNGVTYTVTVDFEKAKPTPSNPHARLNGLYVDLNKVSKKYEGLDGTELAISESQERMAVDVAAEDVDEFLGYAKEENLEAEVIATVTEDPRMTMVWNGDTIVDLSREFLASNGAPKHQVVHVEAQHGYTTPWASGTLSERMHTMLTDLNVASNKGLSERFDSTIGAGTVLMPFGGRKQLTPNMAMVAKLPVFGETTTASAMAWGFNPYIMEQNQFTGAYLSVVESLSKLVAAGFEHENAYLSFQEYFEKLRDEPERWGKPMAAVLGALMAQVDLGAGAIGGKDSMSGTFEQLDVPPTLISFAVAVGNMKRATSPEFKGAGHRVVRIAPRYKADGLTPDKDALLEVFSAVEELTDFGDALAVSTPGYGATAEAIFKMTVGNQIGVKLDDGIAVDDLFAPAYGSFIIELADNAKVPAVSNLVEVSEVGETTEEYSFVAAGETLDLAELQDAWEGGIESVFPYRSKGEEKGKTVETMSFDAPKKTVYTGTGVAKPHVIIPVFPGNNCEYDSAAAFERAGADVSTLIVNNLTPAAVAESTAALVEEIKKSQIIMIPGGFSGGDEPDGSAKFITAFFRAPAVTEAVRDLLNNRDGLMLGICNGFQALIKLGLVPYGDIVPMTAECPTLTFNTIGRHQSMLVRTRIASTGSPWLSKCSVGDQHTVAISHGEGRFVAPQSVLDTLIANGQIATQYVDQDGSPSMDMKYNPNGSVLAIEGITSPDGRVFGKMGHSERSGEYLYKNVTGDKYQPIFEGGVDYFKI